MYIMDGFACILTKLNARTAYRLIESMDYTTVPGTTVFVTQ